MSVRRPPQLQRGAWAALWLGLALAVIGGSGCAGCSGRQAQPADAAHDLLPHDTTPDRGNDARPPDAGVRDLPLSPCGSGSPPPAAPVEVPRGPGIACGVGCRQVTFGPTPTAYYEVHGDLLVYEPVGGHVNLVDLAQEREWRICDGGSSGDGKSCMRPSTDGTRVVYAHFDAASDPSTTYLRFFTYDPKTRLHKERDCQQARECAPENVDLAAGGIVSNFSSFGCNVAAWWVPFDGGAPAALSTTDATLREIPFAAADGARLTWTEVGWKFFRLVVYDTTTKTRRELTRWPQAVEFAARLDGDRLVTLFKPVSVGGGYISDRRNTDIALYELSTGQRRVVSAHPARQEGADISGDLVVWTDWRNNPGTIVPDDGQAMVNSDVFMKDLKTDVETAITCDTGHEAFPRVVGRRVFFIAKVPDRVAIFMIDLDKWDGTCFAPK